MDFDLSADQKLLLETAANFVKRESPVSRLRKLREDTHGIGWDKSTWKAIAELGWLAIAFAEDHGGLGGSFVDAAIVLEQFGTTLVPEPYVPTLLAATAIARAGDAKAHEKWLAPALAGDASLAFAWSEENTRFDASHPKTVFDGKSLTGTKTFVENGHAADALVVSARAPEGVSLFVVAADAKGVSKRVFPTVDGRKAANVSFEGAVATKLGNADAALLDEILDLGAASACAEAVGVMRAVLSMTCEYLRTREQFGVKIGSFQALQHRAVDMFVETELSRSVSMMSSMLVSSRDASERRSAISAAKAQIGESGRYVTQQSIQLHGGIGITDEHDVGLYFKRMHALSVAFGDRAHHVARFSSQPSFA